MNKLLKLIVLVFSICTLFYYSSCKKKVTDITCNIDEEVYIETFDISSYDFIIHYKKNNIVVSFNDVTSSFINNDIENELVYTITYDGFTKDFVIKYKHLEVTNINITCNEACFLSDFNLSNISFNVTYNNNQVEQVYLQESYLSLEDLNKLNSYGKHAVTIMYKNYEKDFIINILEDKYIVSASLNTPYIEQDNSLFNINEIYFNTINNYGEDGIVSVTYDMIVNTEDLTKRGFNTIKVVYNNKVYSFVLYNKPNISFSSELDSIISNTSFDANTNIYTTTLMFNSIHDCYLVGAYFDINLDPNIRIESITSNSYLYYEIHNKRVYLTYVNQTANNTNDFFISFKYTYNNIEKEFNENAISVINSEVVTSDDSTIISNVYISVIL